MPETNEQRPTSNCWMQGWRNLEENSIRLPFPENVCPLLAKPSGKISTLKQRILMHKLQSNLRLRQKDPQQVDGM